MKGLIASKKISCLNYSYSCYSLTRTQSGAHLTLAVPVLFFHGQTVNYNSPLNYFVRLSRAECYNPLNTIFYIKANFFVPLSVVGTCIHANWIYTSPKQYIRKIEVGAYANYNTLHYESDGDALNDLISYDVGFQIHVLANYNLSKKLTSQLGFEYFFYTYDFEDQIVQQTRPNGRTARNYYKYSISENFSISYLMVPIRTQYYPFPNH